MLRTRKFWLPILLATLGLASTAATCLAVAYVETNGTAGGPGVCAITIESFELRKTPGPQPSEVQQMYHVDISIPAGSTAQNTTKLIRDRAVQVLPADFVVTIPIGNPNLVRFDRTHGTFTLDVNANVPGQQILLRQVVPALSPWGIVILAIVLAVAALFILPRRDRRSPAA